jgi:hypothetical protein
MAKKITPRPFGDWRVYSHSAGSAAAAVVKSQIYLIQKNYEAAAENAVWRFKQTFKTAWRPVYWRPLYLSVTAI